MYEEGRRGSGGKGAESRVVRGDVGGKGYGAGYDAGQRKQRDVQRRVNAKRCFAALSKLRNQVA